MQSSVLVSRRRRTDSTSQQHHSRSRRAQENPRGRLAQRRGRRHTWPQAGWLRRTRLEGLETTGLPDRSASKTAGTEAGLRGRLLRRDSTRRSDFVVLSYTERTDHLAVSHPTPKRSSGRFSGDRRSGFSRPWPGHIRNRRRRRPGADRSWPSPGLAPQPAAPPAAPAAAESRQAIQLHRDLLIAAS